MIVGGIALSPPRAAGMERLCSRRGSPQTPGSVCNAATDLKGITGGILSEGREQLKIPTLIISPRLLDIGTTQNSLK